MVNGLSAQLPSSSMTTLRSEFLAGPSGTALTEKGNAPFGDLFRDAIGEAQQLETQAHTAIDGLMRGDGVDVHEAMIAAEKATMGLDLVLAVRNKAVQSYQSVMSMQF